jgi:hypothetical protein
VDDVIRAYEEQMEAIEKLGGKLIVMASRALARVARSPADYERVYDRILSQVREPVILHWLGDMFDPALAGYWGSADPTRRWTPRWASSRRMPAKVDGIKISLLDKDKEIAMRRRLAARGVRMYTGDDFNYAELIAGDGFGSGTAKSDALLGIFDAIAPAASAALGALAKGDTARSTPSWARRCRCRATSSPRPRASTRPAWCSWPGSTATRTTSPWSAASRAPARCCTLPSCSAWPMPPACWSSPAWRMKCTA